MCLLEATCIRKQPVPTWKQPVPPALVGLTYLLPRHHIDISKTLGAGMCEAAAQLGAERPWQVLSSVFSPSSSLDATGPRQNRMQASTAGAVFHAGWGFCMLILTRLLQCVYMYGLKRFHFDDISWM